jgi:hypothetical protein
MNPLTIPLAVSLIINLGAFALLRKAWRIHREWRR